MKRILLTIFFLGMASISSAGPAQDQPEGPSAAPVANVDVHNLAPITSTTNFDPQKATTAYLSRISGVERARSDSYFEGGYALLFIDAFYTIAVSALLMWFEISARMRELARRWTDSPFWQVPIYVAQYLALTTLITLPLTIYESFFREREYGLMNQSFLQWLADQGKTFGLNLVAGMFVFSLIYLAIRHARRTWWLWGTAITVAFVAIQMMIAPVFILPLFNNYTPLPPSPLRADILSLARANGIPADNVYLVDASRQSDRISANVSGFLGTTRISLNDNLLHKGTHDEVLAVLGHEMGHYVLDHGFRLLLLDALLILAGFAFGNWAYRMLTARFGERWNVRTIDDPAGLPVLLALATVYLLVATPVSNTITRTTEIQADMFGINAARKPDGFATVVLKLSAYRKLDPAPWEEFVFYDHPSGHTRIWEVMRWKAEHLDDADIKAGPVSPQ
jgi:Zn-dependent protease with chaperone function